ncbi:hypothetical protein ZTR_09161 [Talaromyces verruculosus]|nr:hypothetical protein ZTR_09161 [Talaromyces verruculosus]
MSGASSGGGSSGGASSAVAASPFAALNLGSAQDDASLEPDLEAAQLANDLRFVAIVDLAKLDPDWSTGLNANSSLVDKHVDALVDQIMQSDRRYEPANRCQDVQEIEHIKNYQASQLNDLVVLDIPSGLIKLEAGQHHRAAVLRLNKLPIHSTAGVFLDKNLDKTKISTMWPVEIYSKEFLDAHPLAQLQLQYNADATKYKSSFGNDMAVIYKAWPRTSEQAKLNLLSSKKNLVNFLNRLLPSNTSLASWLPLLKHAKWSYWMQRFVSHPWGRHTLVASQVTVAFTYHHPRPFFQLFDDISKWFKRYLPGVY